MTQPFSSIGSQMINVIIFTVVPKTLYPARISNRPFPKIHAGWNIVQESAGEIIHPHNFKAQFQTMFSYMRADKTGDPCYQYARHVLHSFISLPNTNISSPSGQVTCLLHYVYPNDIVGDFKTPAWSSLTK